MSAGRLSRVACMSRPKNSFPSTSTCVTGRPFRVYFPFSSTSTPGSFLTSSSTIAPSCTLNAPALYTRVSSLTVSSAVCPSTTASRIRAALSCRSTSPSISLPDCRVTLRRRLSSPNPMQVKRTVYWPAGTLASTYCPPPSVCTTLKGLPPESARHTCTPGRLSRVAASRTWPRNCTTRRESAMDGDALRARVFWPAVSSGNSISRRTASRKNRCIQEV